MSTKRVRRIIRVRRTSAPSSIMSTDDVGYIAGGYSTEAMEEHGARDGAAGILNPLLWGANAFSHGYELLRGALIAGIALVAHAYTEEALGLWAQFLDLRGIARASKREAIAAALDWQRAAFERIALGKRIKAAGLPLPVLSNRVKHVVGLLFLYFGELGLIATAFQILSLSDRPNIPGIPVTDDLHLAALASGTAIVICAHVIGHGLRNAQAADNANEPAPRRARLVPLAALAAAVGAVFALNQIRVSYLTALGVDVDWWPFLVLQLVLLVGGVGLSYLYAAPHASQYAASVRAERKAKRQAHALQRRHENDVAAANARLEQFVRSHDRAGSHADALRGQAAQHNAVYEQAVLQNTPEPVEEFMFTLRTPSPLQDPETGLPKLHEDTTVDAKALSSDAVDVLMKRVTKAIARADEAWPGKGKASKKSRSKKQSVSSSIDEELQELQAEQGPSEATS